MTHHGLSREQSIKKKGSYSHSYNILSDKQSLLYRLLRTRMQVILSSIVLILVLIQVWVFGWFDASGTGESIGRFIISDGVLAPTIQYTSFVIMVVPLLLIMLRRSSIKKVKYDNYEVNIELKDNIIKIDKDGEITFVNIEDVWGVQSKLEFGFKNIRVDSNPIEAFDKNKEFICLLPSNKEIRDYLENKHGLTINFYID